MKATYYSGWFLAICVLETTVLNHIRIWNVKPNIFVGFIVCVAVLRGRHEAGVIGLLVGLLVDLMSGKFGINALLGMYTGTLFGVITRNFLNERAFFVMIFSFFANLVYGFVFFFISFVIMGEDRLGFAMYRIILPETLYSALLTVPIYFLAKKTMPRTLQSEGGVE